MTWPHLTHPQRLTAIHPLLPTHSPATAALALGTTTNAIIGFCSRNGLNFEARAKPANDNLKCAPLPPVEIATDKAVTLLELAPDQCKWPVGDATGSTQMFCGQPTHKRGHCARHHRRLTVRSPAFRPYALRETVGIPAEVSLAHAMMAAAGNWKRIGRGVV